MSIDWIARAEALTPRVRDFVNGRYQQSGEALEKRASRDGRLLCTFGNMGTQSVEDAVAVARRAFEDGRWAKVSVQRRKDALHKLASLVEQHREELALLECLDVGKPIADALTTDLPMAAAILRFSAEAADKFFGKVFGADQSSLKPATKPFSSEARAVSSSTA